MKYKKSDIELAKILKIPIHKFKEIKPLSKDCPTFYKPSKRRYEYEDLEKHFTAPIILSPVYPDNIKLPRKLKKKVKHYCWIHWVGLTNTQRLCYYMDKSNPDYKSFLIKQICKEYNQ